MSGPRDLRKCGKLLELGLGGAARAQLPPRLSAELAPAQRAAERMAESVGDLGELADELFDLFGDTEDDAP